MSVLVFSSKIQVIAGILVTAIQCESQSVLVSGEELAVVSAVLVPAQTTDYTSLQPQIFSFHTGTNTNTRGQLYK